MQTPPEPPYPDASGRPAAKPAAPRLSDSRVANIGANAVFEAFAHLQERHRVVTARARSRFGLRDWRGLQSDSAERLDLYGQSVGLAAAQLRGTLGERIGDRTMWAAMKAVFSALSAGRDDWELAETFFNSTTRRVFTTVGVDADIEFVDTDFETPPNPPVSALHHSFERAPSVGALVERVLESFDVGGKWENLPRDAQRVAGRIEAHLRQRPGALRVVQHAEILKPVFYRNQRAYLVGRLFSGAHVVPLVVALANGERGVYADAALLDEDDVSIVFSYTRSYFHVLADRPYDLVRFLKSIMPRKRLAELYISIGHHKHGKTELYRGLLHHIAASDDRFEIAPGARGMVMMVFQVPSYDLVFKVIRDRFPEPKDTTRQRVMDKYRLVFRHDRAGRLIDAQEFEWLRFDRARFSPELLRELLETAAETVVLDGSKVVLKHAYIERRVIPLDLYVRDADETAAGHAVADYGQALKDLAASNIFPGDILPKNFGVTRQGRVVCYDYDELVLLQDCNFRDMPPARDDDDYLRAEPWFHVGPNDIFPEEFRTFLGMPPPLAELFARRHGDLFEAAWWRSLQERVRAGEIYDVLPYGPEKRLRATSAD